MSAIVSKFSMPQARDMLRQIVARVEAPAIDYIEWLEFEQELDALMETNAPTKAHVTELFARTCSRARQRYHRAVLNGAAWRQ